MILKNRVCTIAVAAAAGAFLLTQSAGAAGDSKIRIGGIESIQWGNGHASGVGATSVRTRSGRTSFNEVTIRRHTDVTSAKLRKASTTGEHFAKVVLELRNQNGKVMPITLEDAEVTSFQMGGSEAGGSKRGMDETISFAFARTSVADRTGSMNGDRPTSTAPYTRN